MAILVLVPKDGSLNAGPARSFQSPRNSQLRSGTHLPMPTFLPLGLGQGYETPNPKPILQGAGHKA